eukprot:1573760-Prymnesium_polylepis.1
MELPQMMRTIQTDDVPFPTDTWSAISPPAARLVSQLLVRRPKDRLTAQQICEHAWLRDDAAAAPEPPATSKPPNARPTPPPEQPAPPYAPPAGLPELVDRALPQPAGARAAPPAAAAPVASRGAVPPPAVSVASSAAQSSELVGEGSVVSTTPSDEALSSTQGALT